MATEPLPIQFGLRVRELREATGISQEAFANKHGFARSYMSKIERGKANVALEAVARLADALDVEPKALFDVPAAAPGAPSSHVKRRFLVPFADDGSCFHPGLRQPRAGTFVVGGKASRRRFARFVDALEFLRGMGEAACWERPDGNGGRGVVKVRAWKPLPSEYRALLTDESL